MDQDAFRKLLSKSNASRPAASGARGSFLPPKTNVASQQKASQDLKPDFKPRHLKKKVEGRYRDRATERREGAASDFAEVEAVLESFEKQHPHEADHKTIEEQRQYLGGDAEHTVLVKGLDFALLEQQKAKAARESSGVDDDALESAFLGAGAEHSKTPVERGKRTREEIIDSLKKKRSKISSTEDHETGSKPADATLDSSKFKPLGFKPIGSSTNNKEPKKKKKKAKKEVQASLADKDSKLVKRLTDTYDEMKAGSSSVKFLLEAEPEPADADFDIFAGVGEYDGVDFDDDDDDAGTDSRPIVEAGKNEHEDSPTSRPRRKWFDDEPELESSTSEIPSLLRTASKGKALAVDSNVPEDGQTAHNVQTEDLEETDEPSTRLAPLMSSAVPSIRDILAADSALDAEEKRKARKEKRKAGGKSENADGEKKKVSAETKLNRDYQKLQSYQAKKGSSS